MEPVLIATYQERAKKLSKLLKKRNQNVVVRLGGTLKYPNHPIQINSQRAIKNSVDKQKQKLLLLNGGIKVLPNLNKPEYPCVLKGIVRSGGNNVKIVKNAAQFKEESAKLINNCDGYIIEDLFKATSEYRLHCTKEKVFFFVKKVKDDPNDPIVTAKNHHNVREFVYPRLWKDIQKECIKAMNVLDLDIACFDVLYNSKGDHSFIIAEANTNPEMLANTMEAYAGELNVLIDKKIKENEAEKEEVEIAEKPNKNDVLIEKYKRQVEQLLEENKGLKAEKKDLNENFKKLKDSVKIFVKEHQNL